MAMIRIKLIIAIAAIKTAYIDTIEIMKGLNYQFKICSNADNILIKETGAGKSILLNALNLILGARADQGMIRHGEDNCEVTASFSLKAGDSALEWLKEQDFDEDDECIIRRVVKRDAGSKNYINGRPTTISNLKALGTMLVDLHGQHEHQSLLRKTTQYTLIDDLAKASDPQHVSDQKQLAQWYKGISHLKQQQSTAATNFSELSAAIDLLNFQSEELEEANVTDEEFPELESELSRLSHAKELIEGYEASLHELTENTESNAESLVGKTLQRLEQLQEFDDNLKAPTEMLHSALANIQEAHHAIQASASKTELDPERLSWVEQRMETLINLARKHRCSETELGSKLTEISNLLSEKQSANKSPEDLADDIKKMEAQYFSLASNVTARRKAAAQAISAQVTEQMQVLGMQGGRFSVAVDSLGEQQISASGADNIEFQVSSNPGSPLQALNKTASGGELSRISLAIQVITSQSSESPTLIFDEVDVGIGGGIAEVVGSRLKQLSQYAQVVCITHLPQVAAQGHTHLLVNKTASTSNSSTSTELIALPQAERTKEIARMLGGIDITETTLAHAEEMLKKAS